MANRNRFNRPYQDRDERPYGARMPQAYGDYPQVGYGSQEYGDDQWPRERGYYGTQSYGERSGRMGGDRYQAPRQNRDYYGTQSYGRNRPYSAYEANQAYRQSSSYDHDYNDLEYGEQDRGFFERAGDEVRSWFGDDDAARRREMDHREDYGSSYDYSSDYTASYPQSRSSYRSEQWQRSRTPSRAERYRASSYGAQGGAFAGVGPKDYFRSDDRIREDACDRLTDDPRIDARNIELRVDKGDVTLTGTVNDRHAKRRIEDCVERISGVKNVQNNLRVEMTDTTHTGSYGSQLGSSTTTATTATETTTAKTGKATV